MLIEDVLKINLTDLIIIIKKFICVFDVSPNKPEMIVTTTEPPSDWGGARAFSKITSSLWCVVN